MLLMLQAEVPKLSDPRYLVDLKKNRYCMKELFLFDLMKYLEILL
jgi:hypothetical protein